MYGLLLRPAVIASRNAPTRTRYGAFNNAKHAGATSGKRPGVVYFRGGSGGRRSSSAAERVKTHNRVKLERVFRRVIPETLCPERLTSGRALVRTPGRRRVVNSGRNESGPESLSKRSEMIYRALNFASRVARLSRSPLHTFLPPVLLVTRPLRLAQYLLARDPADHRAGLI